MKNINDNCIICPTKLSIKSLFGMALQEKDSDTYWNAIQELRGRGRAPETLPMLQNLFRSKNWRKRVLAIDVICQLGDWHKTSGSGAYKNYTIQAKDEAKVMLLAAMSDTHVEVIRSAIFGFGHRPEPDALRLILPYASHANTGIRNAVSFALYRYPTEESAQSLIKLAADRDDDVRNWATFSLANLSTDFNEYIDSDEIRTCLWRNVQDSNAEVRDEALSGLANRHDERIIPVLEKLLSDLDECWTGILDSVETLANPCFYPVLCRLWKQVDHKKEADTYWLNCLKSAMDACNPDLAASNATQK